MTAEPTRIPGPKVAAALTLLVVAIAGSAITIWWRGREPLGTIRELTPVDADRVLLVRDGHRQHGYTHLTLRSLGEGQVWSVPFKAMPPGAHPEVSGQRVLSWVRNAQERLEVHAFDLETGRFAFRAGETPVVRGRQPSVELVVVGTRAVASVGGHAPRVDLVDIVDGRVVASHELPGERDQAPRLRVTASGVEVRPADDVVRLLAVDDGRLMTLPPLLEAAATARPVVVLAGGIARLAGPEGVLEVRALGEGGARGIVRASEQEGRLWVAAGASVAAVDVAAARVLGHHGPLRFEVTRRAARPAAGRP